MQSNIQELKARRREHGDRFLESKARFTYYTVSLPFAILAVAVSSFPYGSTSERVLVLVEVTSWLLLLFAGGAGLRGKWGEMEISRKSSIIDSATISRAEEARPMDADYARAGREQENKRIGAERAEEFGTKWLYRLLPAGLLMWLASRTVLAFCSAALA